MGREDQVEERAVLDSIYPDEITELSEHSYTISITLDIVNEAGDESKPPIITLTVDYPEEYPDVEPILDISAPEDQDYRLFSIEDDKPRLVKAVEQSVQENMGMPMIFTIVSTLKEAAEEIIAERQEVEKQEHIKRVMAIEAEENKKFHGTKVTRESFMKWRDAFMKEIEDKEKAIEEEEKEAEKKANRGKVTEVKLTGKQLWERGLAGKVDEDAFAEEVPVEEMKKVKV